VLGVLGVLGVVHNDEADNDVIDVNIYVFINIPRNIRVGVRVCVLGVLGVLRLGVLGGVVHNDEADNDVIDVNIYVFINIPRKKPLFWNR
jgi:hypothetical protein